MNDKGKIFKKHWCPILIWRAAPPNQSLTKDELNYPCSVMVVSENVIFKIHNAVLFKWIFSLVIHAFKYEIKTIISKILRYVASTSFSFFSPYGVSVRVRRSRCPKFIQGWPKLISMGFWMGEIWFWKFRNQSFFGLKSYVIGGVLHWSPKLFKM